MEENLKRLYDGIEFLKISSRENAVTLDSVKKNYWYKEDLLKLYQPISLNSNCSFQAIWTNWGKNLSSNNSETIW